MIQNQSILTNRKERVIRAVEKYLTKHAPVYPALEKKESEMTKQTEKEVTVGKQVFKRRKASKDMVIITKGETLRFIVGETVDGTSKNYPNGFQIMEITDLETGEEKNLWLSGGLKGKLKMANAQKGMILEVTGLGETTYEVDGETRHTFDYDVYLLEQ